MGCALEEMEDGTIEKDERDAHLWTIFGGRLIPIVAGADEDGDDDDDDDVDDDDDDVDDGNGGGDDASSKRVKELSDEAARHRVRAKTQRTRAEKAEAKLSALAKKIGVKVEDLEDEASISKLEIGNGADADSRVKEMEADMLKLLQTNTELEESLRQRTVDDEIRDMATTMGFRSDRLKRVLRNIDRDDIEIDEDGKVLGVRDALEALKTEVPEWLSKSGGQDEDEDDDEETGSTGSKSASSSKKFNGSKKSKSQLDKESLLKKYPALNR